MKIAAFEIERWEREAFDELSDQHEVVCDPDPLNGKNANRYADADIVTPFIHSRIDEPTLDRLPNLKLITTRSTGYDHIDIDACSRRGIAVANVPTYGENTVAEHVFGLLLTLSHRLDQAIERTRRGDFSARGLQGFDLRGKTIGIVGTGAIGRHTAAIARGFGMNVLAYDIAPDSEWAARHGVEYVGFDRLLAESDVISLHVPSTPQTRNLLSRPQFDQMKTGVVIINTARGDLIDMRAFTRALAEGKVAGAGLDVLTEEPTLREEAEVLRSVYERQHGLESLLADHVLLRLRNVVVTPHSAFNTREAVGRILQTTIDNIRAFAAGQPQNLVTKS